MPLLQLTVSLDVVCVMLVVVEEVKDSEDVVSEDVVWVSLEVVSVELVREVLVRLELVRLSEVVAVFESVEVAGGIMTEPEPLESVVNGNAPAGIPGPPCAYICWLGQNGTFVENAPDASVVTLAARVPLTK